LWQTHSEYYMRACARATTHTHLCTCKYWLYYVQCFISKYFHNILYLSTVKIETCGSNVKRPFVSAHLITFCKYFPRLIFLILWNWSQTKWYQGDFLATVFVIGKWCNVCAHNSTDWNSTVLTVTILFLCLQSVTVQKQGIRQLPIEIEDTYIYQEAQILTIESARGFSMQCNLKFDVCTFSLSGKTTFSYFLGLKASPWCVQWLSTAQWIK